MNSENIVSTDKEVKMDATTNGEATDIIAMIAAGTFDADEAMVAVTEEASEAAISTDVEETNKDADVASVMKEIKIEINHAELLKEEEVKVEEGDVGSDGSKYSTEDACRRVLVKHIKRTNSADDIEDYFFDTYKEAGIEDVHICMVYNKKDQKKLFFGNIILTFETKEKAEAFMTITLIEEEKLAYKKKLIRHSLEDVQKRRLERQASVARGESHPRAVSEAKVAEVKSKMVACLNFPSNYVTNRIREVDRYLRECHENVCDVKRLGPKVLVTFKDSKSAERFLGLAYVKFKDTYIGRSSHKEEAKKPDVVKKAEKRKLVQAQGGRSTVTPVKMEDDNRKAVQFKLKGIFAEKTGYRDIKQVLENGHGLDVRFIQLVNNEARVRLLAGSDTAAEVVYRLAKDQVTVNGEILIPAQLTKEEEAQPIRPKVSKGGPQKAKRERISDWSDY